MRVRPKGADRASEDHGEDAIFLAASYGLIPDDWQEDLALDWLLVGDDDRWLSRTCGCAVPRQNGKNGAVEVRELYGLVVLGEKILHTAHEVKTARKAFKRLKHFFGEQVNDPAARYPELNALVYEVRNTNGQEAIVLHHRDCAHLDGGRCSCREADRPSVEIVARSKGSGRGFTVDVLVLDEAQDLSEEALEALLPTISSAPLGNPQIVIVGTPPNAEKGEDGEAFLRVRMDGEPYDDDGNPLEPLDDFLAWTDFGVADGPLEEIDLDSLPLLKANNPALRTGRLMMTVCRTERRRFSAAGYARERLGWWGNRRSKKRADVFGPGVWTGASSPLLPALPEAIGLSVSLERDWGSVGAAGLLPDGTRCMGAVKRQPGTDWLVADAKRRQDDTGCLVAIASDGPASNLIPALEEAGVDLVTFSLGDLADATADTQDSLTNKTLLHGPTPELDAAVAGAVKRKVSDRDVIARRQSTDDVAMLEAAMLAAWAAKTQANADPVAGLGNLDLCDQCGEREHEDPDGEHDYLCPDCRQEA